MNELISDEPLWKTVEEKRISTYALISKHGINPRTINNLRYNKSITLYTMKKLCAILDCQAEGIVRFLPESDA